MTCIGRSLLSSKSWRQIRPAPAGGAGSGASAGWSGARKGRRTDSGSGFPPSCGTLIRWWRPWPRLSVGRRGCGRPRRPSWPRTLPAGSVFRRKPPERMIERLGERDMDYREKAVRCVRETVLPVQAAQFRACGCDLDAQYRKYGDTESFFAKVLQPGRLYEVGYPKCVCPEVLGGETGRRRPLRMFPAECAVYSGTAAARKTHHGPDRGDGAGGGTCCRFAVTVE